MWPNLGKTANFRYLECIVESKLTDRMVHQEKGNVRYRFAMQVVTQRGRLDDLQII